MWKVKLVLRQKMLPVQVCKLAACITLLLHSSTPMQGFSDPLGVFQQLLIMYTYSFGAESCLGVCLSAGGTHVTVQQQLR